MSAPSAATSSREATATASPSRAQLRLQSIAWALGAGLSALLLGLPFGVEAALRAGGCGFFYGLLAFHLQRVDPDDSHLQAGLVGVVVGLAAEARAHLVAEVRAAENRVADGRGCHASPSIQPHTRGSRAGLSRQCPTPASTSVSAAGRALRRSWRASGTTI